MLIQNTKFYELKFYVAKILKIKDRNKIIYPVYEANTT